MIPTCDPTVYIEDQAVGYVRYRRADGRRWEVYGVCSGVGTCFRGAVGPIPTLDSPILPEMPTCCAFEFKELRRSKPEAAWIPSPRSI